MSFALNIRKLRKEKGWSQKVASEKLGIKPHNIGAYEEGRAAPPLPVIQKFIDVYAVAEQDVYSFLFLKDYQVNT